MLKLKHLFFFNLLPKIIKNPQSLKTKHGQIEDEGENMFKLRKKLLFSLISLAMVAFLSTVVSIPTAKATTILVDIDSSADIVDLGEQFHVNVTISNIEPAHDLVGIEFKIRWNTTLLTGIRMDLPAGHIFQAAEDDGNLWVIKKTIDNTAGEAWYMVTCSDLQQGYDAGYLPLVGEGVICKITFNATETEGISFLEFQPLPPAYVHTIKLSNGNAEQITDYITSDSEIQVIPEFSGPFLYILLLTLSSIIVVLYKKFPKKQTLTLRQ